MDHYTRWALIHLGLGMAAQVSGLFAKVHMLVAFVYFLYVIIKNSNKNHEALQAAAYMTGAEVFFRMTNAAPLYETGKYSVAGFLLLGILYQSIRRSAVVYLLYIALLLPSVLVTLSYFDPDFNVRTSVIFNLSGPITLGLAAIYCYSRPISHEVFYRVMEKLLFPILSTAVYVQFYSMSLEAQITGTGSNFALSGGFGPNQVSTILGLGSFVLFMRFFTKLKFKLNLLDAALFLFVTYRAFLTFSRGGVFVAVVMMALLLVIIYLRQPVSFKATFGIKMIFVGGALLVAW
ncbi:MAG: O-antigen ligase domain-containing protein, partial [Flavobacteriaceae bacterium]|nr:O-antigen ligase domain-containing protein [Flavobacteriaceae bacterium]